MGFFSDLKEDLSQAVNELMPDEKKKEESVADEVVNETEVSEVQTENSVEEMMGSEELANLLADITGTEPLSEEEDVTNEEQMMLPESFEAVEDAMIESENAESIADSEESNSVTETMEAWTDVADTQEMSTEEAFTEETDMDVEATEYVTEPEIYMGGVTEEKNHVEEEGKSMDGQYFAENEAASDEKSVITEGMTINGDIISKGSVDVLGTITGNIDILGKLDVSGSINGNSKAAEIYAENAKIVGEVNSQGSVKIGQSSVIIGNIFATSAVIAGAIKGDIDVKGPVILDTSAIVMGNIKSKSVQINNGAVVEGLCSQCYADVNPSAFFDEFKKTAKA